MNTEPTDRRQEESALTTTVPAIVLWVLVSAALLYGLIQTAIKAAALFTGG